MKIIFFVYIIIVGHMVNTDIEMLNGAFNETVTVKVKFGVIKIISYLYYLDIFAHSDNNYIKVFIMVTEDYYSSTVIVLKDGDDQVYNIKLTNYNNGTNVSATKIMCPLLNKLASSTYTNKTLLAEISSSSFTFVTVDIRVVIFDDFVLRTNTSRMVYVDSNSPAYFLYKFKKDIQQVKVIVSSKDNVSCMFLSVQPAECPVYDLVENVNFGGMYQTVTVSGAITTQRSRYNTQSFIIVLVVISTDSQCNLNLISLKKKNFFGKKTLDVIVQEIPSSHNYLLPILVVIAFYFVIYVILITITTFYNRVHYRKISKCNEVNVEESHDNKNNEFEIIPNNFKMHLSDVCKSNTVRNNSEFTWYLIVISVFYILPVIQLVISYELDIESSGNMDICYYNFKCIRPLFFFEAFNNIMSNIGYVFLGVLYIYITWEKHKRTIICNLSSQGLPPLYGLYYSVGFGLVMEGFLSACYHNCPSNHNFQFDTTFMFIMNSLLIEKIYELRHPDLIDSVQSFYLWQAFIIFMAVIGVIFTNRYLWILFACVIIICSTLLTIEAYYFGNWKFNIQLPMRIYGILTKEGLRAFIPVYKERLLLLLIQNALNFSFALYGGIAAPGGFPSFLLSVMMTNSIAYTFYYIFMKIRHLEHFNATPIIYIGIGAVFWGFALYCFVNHPSKSEWSPAISRSLNHDCILFDFYDIHDVWHFLSSLSLFFSFMGLQTIDDNLDKIQRNKIAVF